MLISPIFLKYEVTRGRSEGLEPGVGDSFVTLSYQGLDEVLRKTTIASSLKPTLVTTSEMRFRLGLESREEKAFSITVFCGWDDERPLSSYHQATKALASEVPKSQGCEIETSNEQFNDWINRSGPTSKRLSTGLIGLETAMVMDLTNMVVDRKKV
jgi:hypothetical protein